MIPIDFIDKLYARQKKAKSLLCVGLDIDEKKIPSSLVASSDTPLIDFNRTVIEQTKEVACAYKLNLAFYEVFGKQGYDLIEETLSCIPKDIITILDGKRNDIGNTARKYAQACYETLDADAVTVNPYLGWDGIQPFLEYTDKCSFILCRTSNKSAADIQNVSYQGKPLYLHVAKKIREWNEQGQCGVVVGATYPEELQSIREVLSEDIPFLLPGIGKQGGDVEKTVQYGSNSKGLGAVINSSRGIIYAGSDESYAEDIKTAAHKLHSLINSYR